ncbi:alpha/beta-hydrolase [Schizophyllum commune H4-8]|uniref:alpha/beta-hydrolase n=1 Tax=Schizophyllum commune (strain H4-8 / FGSC 9210) TaxID=578458 RepID=UPI00215E83B1|nr:alpha/beta-hydrolase [Schizophyllum commune H4-8]KAI5896640.1 alpha/beta-hydrolase [Schizophyllum commune H4-8]
MHVSSSILMALPILSLLPLIHALASPLGPVVDLGYAAYAGNSTSPAGEESSSVTFFGGIPYAQQPVGVLRFRAPHPLDENVIAPESSANATSYERYENAPSNRRVADARGWGPPCYQRPAMVGIGSEDCLTLNVWKPTDAVEGDNLPVAGGGFYAGSPAGFPLYDWVAQSNGSIVAVSMAYRLGLLGLLAGSAVAADGDLNAGLLDQRAALDWVQRHIQAFGGDPGKVTIYGESAGGASVVMHMTAYGGVKEPPFARAVAQSIGYGTTHTREEAEGYFANVTSIVGCAADEAPMSCLRDASIASIVSATNRIINGAFTPVIDSPEEYSSLSGAHGFMPDLPSALVRAGNFSAVDFVGGHTTGDGKTFAGGHPEDFQTDQDIRDITFKRWPGVTDATFAKILELYPSPNETGSPFATQWDRVWTLAGDPVFTCMDTFVANATLAKNISSVYTYSWDVPDTVLYEQDPWKGAMHTSDLYFLFQGTNTIPNAGNTFTAFNEVRPSFAVIHWARCSPPISEAVVSQEAIAYWTSFARTGDPSAAKYPTSPSWPPFAADDGRRQRLLVKEGTSEKTSSAADDISDYELIRCAFWMSEEVTAETRI